MNILTFMRALLLCLCLFSTVSSVRAQESLTVQGCVYDVDGIPLPGVNVRVKKTGGGTSTDLEGVFKLQVPQQPIELIFSFIGMESQTVTWKGESPLKATLKAQSVGLDDVVITGYQAIDKRKLSSSIASIDMSELQMPSATSIDQLLQGRVAGMSVLNLSGTPGVAPKVRIRGSSSITGDREPLWVVDGVILDNPVPVSNEELNNIDNANFVGNAISGLNPSDIERIDILKDVSATAIYGVRAANGVIVVTTKRGLKGRPRVSYTGSLGISLAPDYRLLNLMNSKERIEVSEEMAERGLEFRSYQPTDMAYEGELKKLWSKEIDYDRFLQNVKQLKEMNTDWMGLLFRNGLKHQHSTSISGGSEFADYYFSLGYMNQEGTNRSEKMDRLSTLLKINTRPGKNVEAGFKLSISNENAHYTHSSVALLDYAYRTSRAIPAYDAQGQPFFYANESTEFGLLPFNIFNELEQSGRRLNTRNAQINLNVDWRPIEGLKLSSLVGINFSQTKQNEWAEDRSFYVSRMRKTAYNVQPEDLIAFGKQSAIPVGGELKYASDRSVRYNWRNSVEYNRGFGRHHLFASIGQELSSVQTDGFARRELGYMHARGQKFALIDHTSYPLFAELSTREVPTLTDNRLNTVSAYGILTYTYDDRYIANFNIRTDGSNRFGQDKSVRFLPVWSVSGRWNVHNESFLKQAKWLDELAVRVSYGVQGNVHREQTPNLIVKQENYNNILHDFVSVLRQFPNNNLRWEKTVSHNLGLDFSVLNNRLSGTLEIYRKRGYDQIVTRTIAAYNGTTTVTINAGDLENKGWEMALNVVPILTKDWKWSLSFNTGKNHNKVIKEGDETPHWRNYLNGTLVRNGYSVNSFYSYRFKGLDNHGNAMFYGDKETDESGKTIINSQQEAFDAAFVYSGKREPDLSGGFSSTLRYKQLTLNALFSFSMGNKTRLNDLYTTDGQGLPHPQQNMSREFLHRWRKPGDEQHTNIPALSDEPRRLLSYEHKYPIADNYWEMYNKSDIRVVSGSFLRCRSLSLRYDLGRSLTKLLGITGGSITLEGSNLFVLKDKRLEGRDPEQMPLSTGTVPPRAGYSCQINLTF